MKIKAADLREGDLVDLQGDKYADPNGDRVDFQFEYATVESVERETPTCVAVSIQNVDVFGFPPDHEIELYERATRS